MELHLWLSLVAICIMGALSPGPSLALVVKNTLAGGAKAGYASSISHGLGVALYALLLGIAIFTGLIRYLSYFCQINSHILFHFVSPTFFWLHIPGGGLFAIVFAYVSLRALREMWFKTGI